MKHLPKAIGWLLLLFCLARASTGRGQAEAGVGSVFGQITETDTSAGLAGAAVTIEGAPYKTESGSDGNYVIQDIPPGYYQLLFNKVGYDRRRVEQVEIKAGEATRLDAELRLELYELEPFEVVADPFSGLDAGLLDDRRRSATMFDAIGSDLISKTGASDAADIVTKVTGVTVVDGKHAVIRGLSDRYTGTTLNNAEVPTPDPNRRSVQLDMFPAKLIEKVVTTKTFTPDLPGNFTGGGVNIVTKSFPEEFVFTFSLGTSYNTEASLNDDYLTYPGGSLDWLGFDDGTRELPKEWAAGVDDLYAQTRPGGGRTPESRRAAADELVRLTRLFSPHLTPERDTAPLDTSFSAALGDQVSLFDRPFGILAGFSYSRDFSFYQDGAQNRWEYDGNQDILVPERTLSDTRAVTTVGWGGLLNLAYKPHDNHELGFNFLYNRNSEDEARYLNGFTRTLPGRVFETYKLSFTQRELTSFQLRGKHEFPDLLGATSEWTASLAATSQEEPDQRFFTFDRDPSSGQPRIAISGYSAPTRYFRLLEEDNLNLRLDNSIPLGWFDDEDAEFKFGGFYSDGARSYGERRFVYRSNTSPQFEDFVDGGDPRDFLDPDNVSYTVDPFFGTIQFNKYLAETSGSDYDGDLNVRAGYGMIDMPLVDWLRFVGGARYEYSNLAISSTGQDAGESELANHDLLPSLALIFKLNDEMNVRLSYGRTLARPTFREIAAVSVFDFEGGDILVGNRDLQQSSIENLDLRWEWFTGPGEVVSAGVFYKDITQPIEKTTVSANRQVQFQNRDEALVYGAEFEVRKGLAFVDDLLENFFVGANVALIESEVEVDSFEFDAIYGLADVRPLAGQSPYIINADFTYDNPRSGTVVSLLYNVFGERLDAAPFRTAPSVYEQPFHQLDFRISQQFGERWKIGLSAKNLLDPAAEKLYTYNGVDYLYSSHRRGREFGVSLSYDF